MHPIEQLRFVARTQVVDQRVLVTEAADALGFFAADPRGLVTACRQLLSRRPAIGGLWWLASTVVLSDDPRAACWSVLDLIEEHDASGMILDGLRSGFDTDVRVTVEESAASLRRELAHHVEVVSSYPHDVADADVVVVGASSYRATGASPEVLISNETSELLKSCDRSEQSVWMALPAGPPMPDQYWREITNRCPDLHVCEFSDFDRVYGQVGLMSKQLLELPAMPVAPELLVSLD